MPNIPFDLRVRGYSCPPDSLSVNSRYAEASRRPSSSPGSAGSISTIHPSPYGSSLTSWGASARAPLRSTTLPLTGAYTSETDFVDSTSPNGDPAVTSVPTSGTSTYTTSPRASWAKSVIPTRTTLPSRRAHSCSVVYFSSWGNSILSLHRSCRPFDIGAPGIQTRCVATCSGTLLHRGERVGGHRDLLQRVVAYGRRCRRLPLSLPLIEPRVVHRSNPMPAPRAVPEPRGPRRDPTVAALGARPQVLSPRQLPPLRPGASVDLDDVEREVHHRRVADRGAHPVRIHEEVQLPHLRLVDAPRHEDLNARESGGIELPADLSQDGREVAAPARRGVEANRP